MTAVRKISAATALASEPPEDFVPETAEEMEWCLSSWRWRLFSGQLYKIMTKDDDEDADEIGEIIPFKPKPAQREFVMNLHYRNVILKARQLGFTTLIAIMWLDHALFVKNQRVGIIAHSKDDATVIFRDKVKVAYNNLPDEIRELFPLKTSNKSEMVFDHNGSAIRVAVSMRSGTIHRLHISEMGKIAAKFPEKAKEIVTGSLPAVPQNGIAVIESTAEGRAGEFYDIATRAEKRSFDPRPLGRKEWKFHFYPWYKDQNYRLPANDNQPISATDHEYFDKIQRSKGIVIDLQQRKWYVAERENGQSGDLEKMWREYPTTSEECWMRSNEGAYFAKQVIAARVAGRIGDYPFVSHLPVHTFWDIGSGDGTAIWLMQYIQGVSRFPLFIEDWGQGYNFYVRKLRETNQVFGLHHLPHDANQERQLQNTIGRPLDMLMELAPDWSFTIVPRVLDIQHGITQLRDKFPEARFDREGTAAGIEHIETYHKKWSTRIGGWIDDPEKQDGHSEAADALRQWAQGFDPAVANASQSSAVAKMRRKSRPGGLAV